MRKKTVDTIPVLTEKMQEILHTFSRSRTIAASLVQRSQIILLASQGETNQKIMEKTGLHYDNVATWRNRFLENLPRQRALEEAGKEKESKEIERILSDELRSGCPRKFSQEQIVRIVELACKEPCEYGHEVSHWSLSLLARESKRLGIVEDISAKSVSRFLK